MLEIRYDTGEEWKNRLDMVSSKNGDVIANTIENFELIINNDPFISTHLAYNEFNGMFEYHNDIDNKGKKLPPRAWNDTDDAIFMSYIEKNYNLYSENKYIKALNIAMKKHSYNPIKELIEQHEWDRKPRIDRFLCDILKAEDCDYSREVSRMIFFGGIARLYNPGCKFDYMPIFCGDQGIGKSTIISWLALNESFYKEVTTIDGKDGVECLEGGWICEFSELLAMRRTKDVQSLKAFVSRNVDKYRKPYDKYVSIIPRTCIFIGTTNDATFLTDRTGNRRYLPIEIYIPKGELFARKKEIQEYIINCWREALYLMNNGNEEQFYLSISSKYQNVIEMQQESKVVEDPKLLDLEQYLEEKEIGYKICGKEIYTEVFKELQKNMTSHDSMIIATYMAKFKNWRRHPYPMVLGNYGRQRYWVKES